ncbi:hypothetical protein IW262DRAFT_1486694 [Armillaria fumosa]|nr:hypothetical protein IW262DRAFT_1486694 [Armillaria fumosa]
MAENEGAWRVVCLLMLRIFSLRLRTSYYNGLTTAWPFSLLLSERTTLDHQEEMRLTRQCLGTVILLVCVPSLSMAAARPLDQNCLLLFTAPLHGTMISKLQKPQATIQYQFQRLNILEELRRAFHSPSDFNLDVCFFVPTTLSTLWIILPANIVHQSVVFSQPPFPAMNRHLWTHKTQGSGPAQQVPRLHGALRGILVNSGPSALGTCSRSEPQISTENRVYRFKQGVESTCHWHGKFPEGDTPTITNFCLVLTWKVAQEPARHSILIRM